MRAYPEIDIEIQLGEEMIDLAAHGIDLAGWAHNIDGLPGHVSRKLFTFPWIACAAPDYLNVHGVPQTPMDLAGHVQIAFRNKGTGQIDSWRFASPLDATMIRHVPRPKHVFDDGAAA